jgi:hypothetical protein
LSVIAAATYLLAISCAASRTGEAEGASARQGRGSKAGAGSWEAASAPKATPRLEAGRAERDLDKGIKSYFEGSSGRRLYIQVDKPLYKPGETLWVKVWDLRARDLAGVDKNPGLHLWLVSPRGSVLQRKLVESKTGMAAGDFELPEGMDGGEHKIRVITMDGQQVERPVVVASYEAPRIHQTLELLRKAYGPGERVQATLEVKRATGEALAHSSLTGVVQLDGQELPRFPVKTDGAGKALVEFELPRQIALGDGLLTVLVPDGGITESISKPIPILLRKVTVELFPEGGSLVAGLPTRIYFAAKTPLGKPADVAGHVEDDTGRRVVAFDSDFHGMGRFHLRPEPGRSYRAVITRPEGIEHAFPLPAAMAEGCVLGTYDDLDGAVPELVVRVACSKARPVIVTAVQRERRLDTARVEAGPLGPAIVRLRSGEAALDEAQGVARVTLFDADLAPLAERLIYRNRGKGLRVALVPRKGSLGPRDEVVLEARTTDFRGRPVPAELALSVVDDTVVSYADDKTGHMLSRLYLETEVPVEVHEPKKYFDPKEPKAAVGLDRLMGTWGYRRFEWQPVLQPAPRVRPVATSAARPWRRWARDLPEPSAAAPRAEAAQVNEEARAPRGAWKKQAAAGRPVPRLPLQARALAPRPVGQDDVPRRVAPVLAEPVRARAPMPVAAGDAERAPEPPLRGRMLEAMPVARRLRIGPRAERWGGRWGRAAELGPRQGWRAWGDARGRDRAGRLAPEAMAWAPVRVFPLPRYKGERPERRTDFRETIFWGPSVRTDGRGRATVRFPLSDAITTFRVFAEGVGKGMAGRGEGVIRSALPFSMAVKLPLEVSAGDELRLPLTLTNETKKPLSVTVRASFGALLAAAPADARRTLELGAGERRSLFYPVRVTGVSGKSEVTFVAEAGGLKDAFTREVAVEPLGFPVQASFSGEALGTVTHAVDLGGAIPGSAIASVRLYPSPESTLVSGMEALIAEPSGCFEQASSTNYPNVMVLSYLQEHRVQNPQLIARSTPLLERGYRKLSGYESKDRGYEWFGANPGHEALTAYGLLQFKDMARVYPQVSKAMIERTSAWLRSRRDGQGGFQRNPRALDTFGRASKETTDAYITWSLAEAGEKDISSELRQQEALAASSSDPYLLALAAGSLLAGGRNEKGRQAAARLAALQSEAGSFPGAKESITRSGGHNLLAETTSLAALALMRSGLHGDRVRRAVKWLNGNRQGMGSWGATQATVLTLRAMTTYARDSRRTLHPGEVGLNLDGRAVASASYGAGHRDTIDLAVPAATLGRGRHLLAIEHKGKEAMPYSVALSYRVQAPPSSPSSVVELTTSLGSARVRMGETVRLTVQVANRTAQGQPMTLARVGFPGGLVLQQWQLKELREKGLVGFVETRPREVILYFRQLAPSERRTVTLDLVAAVPGSTVGPASRAYLYYTDEHKTWVSPLAVTVDP